MICASIKEKRMSDVMQKLQEVLSEYDLVEIWINEIEDLNWGRIVKVATKPLMVKFTEDDTDVIQQVLSGDVIASNVKFVDLDRDSSMIEKVLKWRNSVKLIKRQKFAKKVLNERKSVKLIISHHDFKKTPSFKEAEAILNDILSSGADIAKIVFTAQNIEDNLVPLRLLANHENLISFCMGDLGKMSRIYASKFGSLIDYVAPDVSWRTAKGQLTINDWQKINKTGYF